MKIKQHEIWKVRFTEIAIQIIVFLVLASSGSAQTCHDRDLSCTSYKPLCGDDAIRKKCRLTCDACTSDPCEDSNGGCHHLCQWKGKTKTCICHQGFKLAADNRTCIDVDECSEGPNPCPAGMPQFCINTIGSYSCQNYQCTRPGSVNYYRSERCCKVMNSSCGVTASIQQIVTTQSEATPLRRILGGTSASSSSWPWQAQIIRDGRHHCGATLISNDWLVGAAHCFKKHSHRRMSVHLGMITGAHVRAPLRTTIVQRRIERVVRHPSHDLYNNDIALIRLSRPVQFNDVISPICLPCGEVPNVGDKCWVTGFGKTNIADTSKVLLEADLPIVDHEMCFQSYRDVYIINGTQMVCAGYADGMKDTCSGDSGGPLACQREDSCAWYLAGVTSFGKGCGLAGFFGVYAKVANYESWIRETIGENAKGLCGSNSCQDRNNTDGDCYSKLDDCVVFPYYMESNCNLACCQLRHKEISNCLDKTQICATYAEYCQDPVFLPFMRKNCRLTCQMC